MPITCSGKVPLGVPVNLVVIILVVFKRAWGGTRENIYIWSWFKGEKRAALP